jgi:predicted cupin superfamily sugar epimerase
MENPIQLLIGKLGLEPLLVEGGMYRQSYCAEEMLDGGSLPSRYVLAHPMCTAIYYLLTDEPDSFSALHRLPSDEIYHFYLGDAVEMLLLHPDRRAERVILGADILGGQQVQFVVPRGAWQGSHLQPGGHFALLGTTMAPGFIFPDFEAGQRADLLARYPQQAVLINQLCRD